MTKKDDWDVFVIHSRDHVKHDLLFKGMAGWLSRFDVCVWKFRDRNGDMPGGEKYPDVERNDPRWENRLPHWQSMNKNRCVDVDHDAPVGVLTSTSAMIVFDCSSKEVSSEILEEIKMLKELRARFGEDQRIGGIGFGLVRFGPSGYFIENYPQLINSILELNNTSEDLSDTDLEETITILSLFAFRNLVRTSLYREVMKSLGELDRALQSFQSLWDKTNEIIQAYPYDLLNSHHPEIRKLIEEIMGWARDMVLAVGYLTFCQKAPEFTRWVLDEVVGDHIYQYLSEEGLETTIEFLQEIGPQALESLLTICREPYYTEELNVKASSTSILNKVVSAMDILTNNKSLEYLVKEFEHAIGLDQRIMVIRAIGEWAQNNRDRKHDAAQIIKSIAMRPEMDREIKLACISAIGDGGLHGMVRWLLRQYEKEADEELRRDCLISLIMLLGKSANPLAMQYIQEASSEARQYVASVAWYIDQDDLYDALLQIEPDNSELAVIVILSLTRTHNPRAIRQTIEGLSSQSQRLQQMAAVSAGDCFEYCQPSQGEREKLIQGLETLSHTEDENLRIYAILSLLISGEEALGHRGVEVINDLILKENYSLARVLIYSGGTHMREWPECSQCIDWLQNLTPHIRHMTTYILGYQRRQEFLDQMTWLQRDICVVPCFYSNPQSHEIMGRTVSQAAALAIRRIWGKIPPQLVTRGGIG
jgi:hypothetical protein